MYTELSSSKGHNCIASNDDNQTKDWQTEFIDDFKFLKMYV